MRDVLEESQMLKVRIKQINYLSKQQQQQKYKSLLSLTVGISLGWFIYLAVSVEGERSDAIFPPPFVNRIYLEHCKLPQEKFKNPNWCDGDTYHLSQVCVSTSDTHTSLFKSFSEI